MFTDWDRSAPPHLAEVSVATNRRRRRRGRGAPRARRVHSFLQRGPDMLDLDALDFAKGDGLVTVVAQDAESGAVLMVAHADREALQRTLDTGEMHYRSRTRGLWHKGATSGNMQRVVTMLADCDGDAVLARVRSAGPACHTGARSCFGQEALAAEVFGALDATIEARATESTPEPVRESRVTRAACSAIAVPLLLAERQGQRRPLADLVQRVQRRPAQHVVDQGVERLGAAGAGSVARTGAPRGRCARRASGWDSGRRSRRRWPAAERCVRGSADLRPGPRRRSPP